MRRIDRSSLLLATVLSACSGYDSAWINTPATAVDASPSDDIVAALDAAAPKDGGVDATPTDATPTDVTLVDSAASDSPASDVRPTDVAVVDVPDVPPAPRCGDHTCNAGETCMSCPADCGACDTCATPVTCGTCTPMGNCGWCRAANRCARGTGTGSTDGMCTGANWAWRQSDCTVTPPDPCAHYTTCATCDAQATCGWCASADGNHCLTGNERGPTTGTCSRWLPFTMMCGG